MLNNTWIIILDGLVNKQREEANKTEMTSTRQNKSREFDCEIFQRVSQFVSSIYPFFENCNIRRASKTPVYKYMLRIVKQQRFIKQNFLTKNYEF